MSLKFIDLFAGIGGIRLGFQDYFGECVFSSELDKYAQMTYEANFIIMLRKNLKQLICRQGTMLYADNRFTIHSRDKFQASYDENGKALILVQRVFVKDSFCPLRFSKQEKQRILNPSETKFSHGWSK